MKIVRMLRNDTDNLAQKDQLTRLYSIEDIKNYPGVREGEAEACGDVYDYTCNKIIGFIKSANYKEDYITFVQCYEDEVEFVEII